MRFPILIVLFLCSLSALGQFDPAAGKPGSLAIYKDSSSFINWAKTCTVTRGNMDMTDPDFGKTSHGWNEVGTGKPDASVISLGDWGSAILEFHQPIKNGEGPDFAVFENSLWDDFLELAFVEVSSDGKTFFRFPSVSLTDTTLQIGAFDKLDPTKLSNLAGKHRGDYGTPFDLDLLKDSSGLDVNEITHVRIVDVIGNIDSQYPRTFDSKGAPINDPFPTPFPSSGFDLDAVGVIHENPVSINNYANTEETIGVFQRGTVLLVDLPKKGGALDLYGLGGKSVFHTNYEQGATVQINVQGLRAGIYLAAYRSNTGVSIRKFQIR